MNAATGGAAIIGALDLLLKANMSRVRVAEMLMKRAAASSNKGSLSSLAWWHTLNLNHAEYTPVYLALMLYLGLRQSSRSKPLTRGQGIACWCSILSSVMFVAGYLLAGVGAQRPHPLRALGALGRYASYALLLVQAVMA
jgi:uncharacterized membrane protein YecN with MAPEG domain